MREKFCYITILVLGKKILRPKNLLPDKTTKYFY